MSQNWLLIHTDTGSSGNFDTVNLPPGVSYEIVPDPYGGGEGFVLHLT